MTLNLTYHIFSSIKVGEGGFGKVVLGTVQNNNKHNLKHALVAVKYIKRGKNGGTAPSEINNLMKLTQSPERIPLGIVQVYDVQLRKRVVISPLYGPDLGVILSRYTKGVPVRDAAAIALQMVSALEFCHRHSIVHLDVKPGNFVVGYNRPYNTVTLIDFGLSVDLEGPTASKARRVGSPRYMSVRMHRYNAPKPTDDMESLVYTLAMLSTGTLPWKFSSIVGRSHAEKHQLVADQKEAMATCSLFQGLESWFVQAVALLPHNPNGFETALRSELKGYALRLR